MPKSKVKKISQVLKINKNYSTIEGGKAFIEVVSRNH